MNSRVIVRMEIASNARKRFVQTVESLGMTQLRAHSRLIEWFATQPPMIQHAILGHYPAEIRDELEGLILKEIASKRTQKTV